MADTKYCPRCSQALTRPGFCPSCGLAVGYGPGQTAPIDAPTPPTSKAPTLTVPDTPTHADLPRVETTYRSPQRTPAPHPPQSASPPSPPDRSAHQHAGAPAPNRRNGIVLAMLGILCVLALILGGLWFLTRDAEDASTADSSNQDDASRSQTPQSTAPTDGEESKESSEGPLDVAARYENQPCTDALIVVLASSGDPKQDESTIESATKNLPGAKYLQTDKSCKTFNQSVNGSPIFAAYVGPFDTMADACQARVDSGIAASYVRMLSLDRELREICSCHDEASALPRLSIQTAGQPSYDLSLRVYDLQSLLSLAGVNPNNIVTGVFGPETKQMVRTFQRQQRLARDGWVGPRTWARLLDQNCT